VRPPPLGCAEHGNWLATGALAGGVLTRIRPLKQDLGTLNCSSSGVGVRRSLGTGTGSSLQSGGCLLTALEDAEFAAIVSLQTADNRRSIVSSPSPQSPARGPPRACQPKPEDHGVLRSFRTDLTLAAAGDSSAKRSSSMNLTQLKDPSTSKPLVSGTTNAASFSLMGSLISLAELQAANIGASAGTSSRRGQPLSGQASDTSATSRCSRCGQ